MGYLEQAADHLSTILEVMKDVENVGNSISISLQPPLKRGLLLSGTSDRQSCFENTFGGMQREHITLLLGIHPTQANSS
jgi:hypothetical protein